MSLTPQLHQYDAGTLLTFTVLKADNTPFNISTATLLQLILTQPNKIDVVVTPSFVNDGTDGQLKYVTQASDLSIDGWWRMQIAITLPNGAWRTNVLSFKVYPNLP